MNSEQFVFWLQGFFELTDSNNLSPNQVKMIKEHLGLVFNKVTPPLEKSQTPPPLPKKEEPKNEGLFCKKDFEQIFKDLEKVFTDSDFEWRDPRHPRFRKPSSGKLC